MNLISKDISSRISPTVVQLCHAMTANFGEKQRLMMIRFIYLHYLRQKFISLHVAKKKIGRAFASADFEKFCYSGMLYGQGRPDLSELRFLFLSQERVRDDHLLLLNYRLNFRQAYQKYLDERNRKYRQKTDKIPQPPVDNRFMDMGYESEIWKLVVMRHERMNMRHLNKPRVPVCQHLEKVRKIAMFLLMMLLWLTETLLEFLQLKELIVLGLCLSMELFRLADARLELLLKKKSPPRKKKKERKFPPQKPFPPLKTNLYRGRR